MPPYEPEILGCFELLNVAREKYGPTHSSDYIILDSFIIIENVSYEGFNRLKNIFRFAFAIVIRL